jgi:hypothetical protein
MGWGSEIRKKTYSRSGFCGQKKHRIPNPGSASQLLFWDKSLLFLCCSHGGKEPNPFDDESEEWDEGDADTGKKLINKIK